MRTEGLTHISEILAGWQPPTGDSEVEVLGESSGRFDQRWRLAVVGVLVVAMAAALAVFAWPRAEKAVAPPVEVQPMAPAVPVPDPVADLTRALEAWGRFAVSGDPEVVEPWFADGGPQLEQLRREAETLAMAPIGGNAYEFRLEQPEVVAPGIDSETIRSVVSLGRQGEEWQRYVWELEMRWSDTARRWQLWTVRTVE